LIIKVSASKGLVGIPWLSYTTRTWKHKKGYTRKPIEHKMGYQTSVMNTALPQPTTFIRYNDKTRNLYKMEAGSEPMNFEIHKPILLKYMEHIVNYSLTNYLTSANLVKWFNVLITSSEISFRRKNPEIVELFMIMTTTLFKNQINFWSFKFGTSS
jgi:hypothetical protein